MIRFSLYKKIIMPKGIKEIVNYLNQLFGTKSIKADIPVGLKQNEMKLFSFIYYDNPNTPGGSIRWSWLRYLDENEKRDIYSDKLIQAKETDTLADFISKYHGKRIYGRGFNIEEKTVLDEIEMTLEELSQ